MTTEEAMHAAVLANPADDVVRKAYADCLRENGQEERADFIEVQLRIAELRAVCSCGECVRLRGGGQQTNGGCAVDRERVELPDGGTRNAMLRMKERELRPKGDRLYCATGPYDYITGFEYRRGFVSEILCTLAEWCGGGFVNEAGGNLSVGIGPQIVRRHPVERVVTDREPLEGVTKLWMWSQGISERPHAIPLPVWNLLTDYAAGSSTITRLYPTRKAAISALSVAAIAWAKGVA